MTERERENLIIKENDRKAKSKEFQRQKDQDKPLENMSMRDRYDG